mmetsp:Transcript_30064/g.105720  ORF Transcript_30064/g.105720 Transcript_30064/m.105720 type:complete len:255 (-) Transcript_30064:380-1144(-)
MNGGCASRATLRKACGSTASSNWSRRASPPSSATQAARCAPWSGACSVCGSSPSSKSFRPERRAPQSGSANIAADASSMTIQHLKLAACACIARSENVSEDVSVCSAPAFFNAAGCGTRDNRAVAPQGLTRDTCRPESCGQRPCREDWRPRYSSTASPCFFSSFFESLCAACETSRTEDSFCARSTSRSEACSPSRRKAFSLSRSEASSLSRREREDESATTVAADSGLRSSSSDAWSCTRAWTTARSAGSKHP